MDFNDSPEEAAFRAEVRAWLAKHSGPFDLDRLGSISLEAELALGRRWMTLKADQGFSKVSWPKPDGGLGGTGVQEIIFLQEENRVRLPTRFFHISIGMPLPTMRRYATPEQKRRYLGPALRGEEIWCQLFSEPAAGSDVGGIRMRADRVDGGWLVNGQKTWTSWAQISDFGLLLARTDPSVPKHKGLTAFFVDMRLPGIEVRPIKQLSGGQEFNEVFFTDVIVPDECRLCPPGQGWGVGIATLMEERFTVSDHTGGGPNLLQLLKFLSTIPAGGAQFARDGEIRRAIARWYSIERGLVANRMRAITSISKGELPGPEAALSKLVIASKLQQTTAFVIDRLGPAGLLTHADADRQGSFQQAWLIAAGYRIAGGTDEILRNTIAERVLGLPSDIRTDRDKPFSAN
jgi:alkylation response protein AidB-like acyl-CoA dehydrogenase